MLPSTSAGLHQRHHCKKEKFGKKDSLSLAETQIIKLHQSENAWIPSHKMKQTIEEKEKMKRNVQSVLNKLTFQKFQILLNQLKKFNICSKNDKDLFADLIYENAIYEPHFSILYASLCKHLTTVPCENWKYTMTVLISKCRVEFENHCNDQTNKIGLAQVEGVEEIGKDGNKKKAGRLGNIRFISELFKVKLILVPALINCVDVLLVKQDEESLECLCLLLKTAGKELLHYGNCSEKKQVNDYFVQIQKIIEEQVTSTRMRFLLQDILDLRNNNWIPRRIEIVPRTIDEIHQEAILEQRKQWPWYQNTLHIAAQSNKQDQTKYHTDHKACLCESNMPATTKSTKKNLNLPNLSESTSDTLEEARRILAAEDSKGQRNSVKRVKKKSKVKSKNRTDSEDG